MIRNGQGRSSQLEHATEQGGKDSTMASRIMSGRKQRIESQQSRQIDGSWVDRMDTLKQHEQ